MSAAARFLFDECIGKPSMEKLRSMVQSDAEFAHIRDFYDQKTSDQTWIPQMAREGGWIVITADGGRQSRKGEKLPEICKENGITHVVLSPKLHKRPASDKIAALAEAWSRIASLADAPAGSQYALRYRTRKGSGELLIDLVKIEKKAKPK